jgi:hypothetical protein
MIHASEDFILDSMRRGDLGPMRHRPLFGTHSESHRLPGQFRLGGGRWEDRQGREYRIGPLS